MMMQRMITLLLLSGIVFYFGYRMAVNENVLSVKIPCYIEDHMLSVGRVKKILYPCDIEKHSRKPRQQHAAEVCPSYDYYGHLTLYKHIPVTSSKILGALPTNGVLQDVFFELHHPDSPARAEFIIAARDTFRGLVSSVDSEKGKNKPTVYSGTVDGVILGKHPYEACSEVYLTRSGSRESMPNKCVAVTMVVSSQQMSKIRTKTYSPWYHSHRNGIQAKMRDMYSNDWPTAKDMHVEESLLSPVLSGLKTLVQQLRMALGEPLNTTDGTRRAAVVMVANEGVMDLLLNFICSARAANVDLSTVVVFLGQPEYKPLIESMGAKAIYHEFYGDMPKKAAGYYGDNTFGKLMWLKTTSVYVTHKAGFDVIFQDADLVWMHDPIPFLYTAARDIAFMDDGARSTRFTPFFVNSGFYFLKKNRRTQYFLEALLKSGPSEISVTHSHQAVLTRHLTEAHHLAGLRVDILDNLLFPSGALYHHNKTFIGEIKSHQRFPNVFHMCWTSSRDEKVKYFKELGLWFLPTENIKKGDTPFPGSRQYECEVPAGMLSWVNMEKTNQLDNNIRDHCCQIGNYFHKKK